MRPELHNDISTTGRDFRRLIGQGYTQTEATTYLAAISGVKRTSIYKRLRKLGILSQYNPRRTLAQARGLREPMPAEQIAARRVDRDPCPRCGVRADFGCHHGRVYSLTGVVFA